MGWNPCRGTNRPLQFGRPQRRRGSSSKSVSHQSPWDGEPPNYDRNDGFLLLYLSSIHYSLNNLSHSVRKLKVFVVIFFNLGGNWQVFEDKGFAHFGHLVWKVSPVVENECLCCIVSRECLYQFYIGFSTVPIHLLNWIQSYTYFI